MKVPKSDIAYTDTQQLFPDYISKKIYEITTYNSHQYSTTHTMSCLTQVLKR